MATPTCLRIHLADLAGELGRVKQHHEKLERHQLSVQAKLDHATRYPVLALPAEISSEIFVHCLPDSITASLLEPPLLLASVCKSWARIVMSTPALWQSFILHVDSWEDDDELAVFMYIWVHSSDENPVKISLTGDFSRIDLPRFMADLQKFSGRISSLILTLDSHEVQLFRPYSFELPELQELSVNIDWSSEDPVDLTGFLVRAPRLSKVELDHIPPSAVALPWQQLTDFRCRDYSGAQLLEALRLLPNLVHGNLDVSYDNDGDLMLDMNQHKMTFPHLQHLSISESALDPAQPYLFELLTLPELRTLETDVLHDAELDALLHRSQYPPLQRLCFSPGRSTQLFKTSIPLLNQLVDLEFRNPSYAFIDQFLKRFGSDDTFLPALQDLHLRGGELGQEVSLSQLVMLTAPAVMARHSKAQQESRVQPLRSLRLVTMARTWTTFQIPAEYLVDYRKLQEDGVEVFIGDTRGVSVV